MTAKDEAVALSGGGLSLPPEYLFGSVRHTGPSYCAGGGMAKKIIQISSIGYSDKGDRREALYALDDDGQVWVIDPHDHGAQWREITALPDKAAAFI